MNKTILMGRLTKDPDIKYSGSATPVCVARYTLAVPRKFKRENEPEADFIKCVAFSKSGEFAEKWLKKGMMIAVCGRISVTMWEDKDGNKHWNTEVIVEEHSFTGDKGGSAGRNDGNGCIVSGNSLSESDEDNSFSNIGEPITDGDVPF